MSANTSRVRTPIDERCDRFVEDMIKLSPMYATSVGVKGYDHKWDDMSPAGLAEVAELQCVFLRDIEAAEPLDEVDRITRAAVIDRTHVDLEMYEMGEGQRSLNNIASPAQNIRDTFPGMPVGGVEAATNIIARLEGISSALAGYQESLLAALARKHVASIRQVDCVIKQAEELTADNSFFDGVVRDALASPGDDDPQKLQELVARAQEAVRSAKGAYCELAEFLRHKVAPVAPRSDAFGRERYTVLSDYFVGARVDLDDAYEWGCAQLAKIDAEQQAIADKLYGKGTPVKAALEYLNKEERYTLHGVTELQQWMQKVADEAIRDLGATHFDIPERVRTIECMIDKAGTGGIYYTGPADDFSRPGRMWWSVPPEEDTFHTWQELTTVFHEGVPGHHLQIGITTDNAAELNKWRRLYHWNSGHGEGWALYSEELMAELGYHDDLGTRMGMLDGQRLRAARVMLDIGVHLGKTIPEGGHVWDGEYAWEFLKNNVAMAPGFLRFECDRYLGWAGQAPSYKLGQRLWQQLRTDYVERFPGINATREFHARALPLGALPMRTLRCAVLGE